MGILWISFALVSARINVKTFSNSSNIIYRVSQPANVITSPFSKFIDSSSKNHFYFLLIIMVTIIVKRISWKRGRSEYWFAFTRGNESLRASIKALQSLPLGFAPACAAMFLNRRATLNITFVQ